MAARSAVDVNRDFVGDDPSDWPANIKELRILDNLLRCSICFEYFNIAVTATGCYHNFCSLCARKHISYKAQCPSCQAEMHPNQLKCNRVLDEIVKTFVALRPKLLLILREHNDLKLKRQTSNEMPIRTETNRSKKRLVNKPAKASIGRKRFLNRSFESENDDDDDDFEPAVSSKRKIKERKYSGSSTSSLSDVGSSKDNDSNNDKSLGSCPICNKKVHLKHINTHLDACLSQTGSRRSRRSKNDEKCNEPVKKRSKPNEFRERRSDENEKNVAEGMSIGEASCNFGNEIECHVSDDAVGHHQEDLFMPRRASNDLLPSTEGERRKKLPSIVISGLSERQLKAKLKQYGLSCKGDKKALLNRLKSYQLLYDSQCDAVSPMPVSEIIKKVESTENTQKKLDKGHVLVQTFDLTKTDKEKQEFNEKYLVRYKAHFDSLIEDVKARRKKERGSCDRQVGAAKSSESNETAKLVLGPTTSNDPTMSIDDIRENTKYCKKENMEIEPSFVRVTTASEGLKPSFSQDKPNTQHNRSSGGAQYCTESSPQCTVKRDGKKFAKHQSQELKAIHMLDKAVSKALTVVEKLHSAHCTDSAEKFRPEISNASERSCPLDNEADASANLFDDDGDHDDDDDDDDDGDFDSDHDDDDECKLAKDKDSTITRPRASNRERKKTFLEKGVGDNGVVLISDSDDEIEGTGKEGDVCMTQSTPRRNSFAERDVTASERVEASPLNRSRLKNEIMSATSKQERSTALSTPKTKVEAVTKKGVKNLSDGKFEANKSKVKGSTTKREKGKDPEKLKGKDWSVNKKGLRTPAITTFFKKVNDDETCKEFIDGTDVNENQRSNRKQCSANNVKRTSKRLFHNSSVGENSNKNRRSLLQESFAELSSTDENSDAEDSARIGCESKSAKKTSINRAEDTGFERGEVGFGWDVTPRPQGLSKKETKVVPTQPRTLSQFESSSDSEASLQM